MSYYVRGGELSYADYLTARDFCKEITTATHEAGQRVSVEISRQTREVIASNEQLSRENIRATDAATARLSDAMNEGFTELSYEIRAGLAELNASFHWGFAQMLASMGRMNDALTELIKIAKTPAQTAAYEQYEIARDAFRQGLYEESLESLDKAINGDHTTSGYKLEWRFHQLKGVINLGFAGSDLSLLDLAGAEQSFKLAARYAKSDYSEHAAQAYLSAGWAAYCQGRLAEAFAYTEQALAVNPNFGEALFQSAKVQTALGKFDAALPVLSKAIDVDRLFVLKATGDGDFQRHDEKLRHFLDALRIEKYRQSEPIVREALKATQTISVYWTEKSGNDAIRHIETFLKEGASWPLMDMLSCVQQLDRIVADARRTPITVTVGEPGPREDVWEEQESYMEDVVIQPGGFFKKAITQKQSMTRMVTRRKTSIGIVVPIEFCSIPAGHFVMRTNVGRYGNPKVLSTKVSLSHDFYLGKYPVTQAQWDADMGRNTSRFKGAENPVEVATWTDCQRFISALNKKTQELAFRLPTEAEWQYACQAGSTGIYFFGDNQTRLGDYAWFKQNSNEQTHPVGSKKPNAWGLHDMLGNISELCQDMFNTKWHEDHDTNIDMIDPQGPSSPYSPELTHRVACGADYHYSEPSYFQFGGRCCASFGNVGFRLLAEVR